MTRISGIDAPPVDPVERRPRRQPGSGRPGATVAVVAALVLTVVNLAAAIHLYRALQDMRAIETRLEHLAAFEQRLVGRFDVMNAGVQERLDILSHDMQAQFGQIHDAASRLRTAMDRRAPAVVEAPVWGGPDAAIDFSLSGAVGAAGETRVEIKAPPPEAAPPAPAQRRSRPATYERIQSPDGKVHYRQVQ